MDIVVLDGYTLSQGDLSWDKFAELGNLTVYDRTSKDEIIDRIGNAEIVITNKTPIDKRVIDATNIKYIGVLATGYNIIDIEYCNDKNIVVCNIPEYSTNAVAQLTFAFILELANKVGLHNNSVKNGNWAECKDFSYTIDTLSEISGKTIGLIGFGNIAKAVAKIANAFNMQVVYNKPSGAEPDDSSICHYISIDELFMNSDFISLHCPLTESTKEIINQNTINMMKESSVIINTARGGLVNENDLAYALNSGRISYYCCDVLNIEPPNKDNVLINAKNTFITPHIAWQSFETRNRLMDIAVDNLKHYLYGNIQNRIGG